MMTTSTSTTGQPLCACNSRVRRHFIFFLQFIFLGLSLSGEAWPQGQPVQDRQREYNVKAVFLYSFGRYASWPKGSFAATGGKFVIGVLGESPFSGALEAIAKKRKVKDREIELRTMDRFEDYQPCQILFISDRVSAEQRQLAIDQLRGTGVLIVGETDGVVAEGATIGFFLGGTKVHFEINSEAARREQLRLDAKLLALGKSLQ